MLCVTEMYIWDTRSCKHIIISFHCQSLFHSLFQTNTHTYTHPHMHTDRQTDSQTDRHTHPLTHKHTNTLVSITETRFHCHTRRYSYMVHTEKNILMFAHIRYIFLQV